MNSLCLEIHVVDNRDGLQMVSLLAEKLAAPLLPLFNGDAQTDDIGTCLLVNVNLMIEKIVNFEDVAFLDYSVRDNLFF